jgi:hypothetical protein
MVWSRILANVTNKLSNLREHCSFTEFSHHLYISQVSPDDVLSESKHVASEIIKTFLTAIYPVFIIFHAKRLIQAISQFCGTFTSFVYEGYAYSNEKFHTNFELWIHEELVQVYFVQITTPITDRKRPGEQSANYVKFSF